MDCLVNNEVLIGWLTSYGSISLFLLLIFGILALPIPEETLLVVSGILINKGALSLVPTLLAGYLGSMVGISMSCLVGCVAGRYLLAKFEKKRFVQKHLEQAHRWFDRFGKWALFIGYFIPGVRHFTGFSAGMMKMEFRKFALFAYSGAFFWVSTFISIGYFFGAYCFAFLEKLDIDMTIIIISAASLIVLYLVFYRYRSFFVGLWKKFFH